MAYSEKERVSVMLVSFPHVHKCTMLVVGRHDIKIKIVCSNHNALCSASLRENPDPG